MNKSIVIAFFQDTVDSIPYSDKQAYLDALECAPDVVADETDPFEYMLFDEYIAWAAVNRVIQYWEWKKRLFGDRMFLPLHDLSGSGALNEEDLAVLWTGYVANLPKQKDGMSVILIDRTRLNQEEWNNMDSKTNLRIFMFATSLAAKEHKFLLSSRSLIVLNIVAGGYIPNSKRNHSFRDIAMVVQSIPIKISCVRAVIKITCISFANFFLRLVMPAVDRNMQSMMMNFKRTIDLVISTDSIRHKLPEYSLDPNGVPYSLGGSWDYSEYYQKLSLLCRPRSNFEPQITVSELEGVVELTKDTELTVITQTEQQIATHIRSKDCTSQGKGAVFSNFGKSTGLLTLSNVSPIFGSHYGMSRPDSVNMINTCLPTGTTIRSEECLTDPSLQLWFLRHNNFDIQMSCHHLGNYWHMRERLFMERAFLPMIQCDGGALSTDDVFTLNSGFIMVAPGDRVGNFVLVFEPSKAVGHSKRSQRRCYFYVLNVLIEQMVTGKEKLVILLVLGNMTTSTFNSMACFTDIVNVFPLDTQFLLVFLEPVGLGWLAYKSGVDDIIENLFNVSNGRRKMHTIQGSIDISILVLYGLQAYNLPVCIGGSLNMESFRLWQKERSRMESQRQACKKYAFGLQGYDTPTLYATRKSDTERTLSLECNTACVPSASDETCGKWFETSKESEDGVSVFCRNETEELYDCSNDDDSTLYSIDTQLFD